VEGLCEEGRGVVEMAGWEEEVGGEWVAVVGSGGEGEKNVLEEGVERCVVIGEGLSAEESRRRAGELLRGAARKVVTDAPRARGG
jgi:hypothetical protein